MQLVLKLHLHVGIRCSTPHHILQLMLISQHIVQPITSIARTPFMTPSQPPLITQGDGATPAWGGETPAVLGDGMKKGRSRWDETPANIGPSATPMVGAGVTPGFFSGATPAATMGMETPATAALRQQQVPMTPEQYQEMKQQREMWERNRPLTDEELDAMLPGEKEGYKVGVAQTGCHGLGMAHASCNMQRIRVLPQGWEEGPGIGRK